jgi:putative protease
VFEDERGLYLFNSRELALFEYIPALKDAGVTSIKIEGRMKSIHYIASVVSFYRRMLDGEEFTADMAFELLNRVANRGYSQGFMKGGITPDDYSIDESLSTSETIFIANVTEETQDGKCVLEIRNKIHAGDVLETLSPDGSIDTITMGDPLELRNGEAADFANNSQFVLLDEPLQPYTILRRVP